MRLIDADALPIWSYTQMWEEGQGIKKCCDAVENAPTIDAIPISFLYEYMALCESVGAYQSKETIECLIDDWREENGEKDEC